MTKKISYSRGFPYGAPLCMIRGGATKDERVKGYLRDMGFRWDGAVYAWTNYFYKEDFTKILQTLRDEYGCEVVPKDGLDPNYVIDLSEPTQLEMEV